MNIKGFSVPVILASVSPRRTELLKALGLDFTAMPPVFDENGIVEAFYVLDADEKMGGLVEKIAVEKAKSAAANFNGQALFIAADTLVVLDGKALGKPSDEEDARRMLEKLSGRTHKVATGICIFEKPGEKCRTSHVITEVTFKDLSNQEIENYLKSGEPMDKAGAYGIQGKGGLLVEGIRGCYYNVVGLPLPKLYLMLREFGIDLLTSEER
ncbi:MAG: Maf family protein [Chloroflexi bacterium]|nr:Maf family protein [Chloroflexota bacterium]